MSKHIFLKITGERILIAILLLVIVLLVVIWRPWIVSTDNNRTISVTGTGSVSSAPDEFQFYPTYQDSGTDKQKTLTAVNTKVTTVMNELEKLGVSKDDITLSENVFNAYWVDNQNNTVSVSLYVVVKDKDLAQKVQDYLLTTTPYGQMTPQPTFSKDKYKTLSADARNEALKDAKTKAESSASELGSKVGKVITVSDESDMGVVPMYSVAESSDSSTVKTTLPISPGKQEVTSTVKVVYELK